MFAVAVAMAATGYAFMTGMIGSGTDYTPIVYFEPETTGRNARLTIYEVTDRDIFWSDVEFILVDLSNQTQWQNGAGGEGWNIKLIHPTTGKISAGQMISIETTLENPLPPDTPLVRGHQYQFSLIYIPSGGTMGLQSWFQ